MRLPWSRSRYAAIALAPVLALTPPALFPALLFAAPAQPDLFLRFEDHSRNVGSSNSPSFDRRVLILRSGEVWEDSVVRFFEAEPPAEKRFVRWAPADPVAFAALRAELARQRVGTLTGSCEIGGIPESAPDVTISWYGAARRSTTFRIAPSVGGAGCADERHAFAYLAIDSYLFGRLESAQAKKWLVP